MKCLPSARGLLYALTKLGNDPASLEGLSADSLFNTVTQDLAALQFKQTPVLIEPPNAPGLRSRSFLTLQPIAQAAAGASPASATQEVATSAPGKGFQPSATTTHTPEADEKFWGQVVAAAITAAPGIYQAIRGKEFQPGD